MTSEWVVVKYLRRNQRKEKGTIHTFIMQRDNKSPRQRTSEIEINIRPPIIRNVTLLNHALLLEFLMRELIRTQDLMFLSLPARALALGTDVVEV